MEHLLLMGLAAAALGAFVGLDRRLAGARHALHAHAVAGVAGSLGGAGAYLVDLLMVWGGELGDASPASDTRIWRELLLSPWGLLALVALVVMLGAGQGLGARQGLGEGQGLGRLVSRLVPNRLTGNTIPTGDVLSLSCAVCLGMLVGTASYREVLVGILGVVAMAILRPRPPLPLVSNTGAATFLKHSDPWREAAGPTASLPAHAANYIVYPLALNAATPEGWRLSTGAAQQQPCVV